MPGGSAGSPPLMQALDVIGSDVDNFECPWCGSNDRDRHLLLYIEALGLTDRFRSSVVAHFAPERSLSAFILAQSPANYLRIDLNTLRPIEIQTNIENIAIATGVVDILMANHVLEHIGDLERGLGELHRILKPGGLAILQTPFSSKIHNTFCDTGIDSDHARLHAYGQSDHVRLFGRDIVDRICAPGFKPLVKKHDELLNSVDPAIFGVNALEPFFLFEKL